MTPNVAYPLADRIAGAVTAYACGDALGLPWEQFPPTGADTAQIEALPAREGWERGATSDDTALTLLVAQHLAHRGGTADARALLQTLAARAGSIWPLRASSRHVPRGHWTVLPAEGCSTSRSRSRPGRDPPAARAIG